MVVSNEVLKWCVCMYLVGDLMAVGVECSNGFVANAEHSLVPARRSILVNALHFSANHVQFTSCLLQAPYYSADRQ